MQADLKQELINYRMTKAIETKEDARLALDNDRYRTALNRIYYAIFYIVSALSVKHDFSTSRHRQLMGWFNVNFVKTGKISIKLWKTYKNSYDRRQECDYDDFVEYDKDEIGILFDEMSDFLDGIIDDINSE
jgi:uncharacterized protein (UPF0332 family)